jgi:hypothetical protein
VQGTLGCADRGARPRRGRPPRRRRLTTGSPRLGPAASDSVARVGRAAAVGDAVGGAAPRLAGAPDARERPGRPDRHGDDERRDKEDHAPAAASGRGVRARAQGSFEVERGEAATAGRPQPCRQRSRRRPTPGSGGWRLGSSAPGGGQGGGRGSHCRPHPGPRQAGKARVVGRHVLDGLAGAGKLVRIDLLEHGCAARRGRRRFGVRPARVRAGKDPRSEAAGRRLQRRSSRVPRMPCPYGPGTPAPHGTCGR